MLEAIQQKLLEPRSEDTEWPLMKPDGTPQPQSSKLRTRSVHVDSDIETDSDEGDEGSSQATRKYWEKVQQRYSSLLLEPSSSSAPKTADLPPNWTVVHVTITEDKNTLLVSRQECGTANPGPIVFCVPLKGRRDGGAGEDEEHLAFEDAMQEFSEIIRLSDEGTKNAINIRSDDQDARSNWWKQRNQLDQRMKDLLENIEFCWLGAFKVGCLSYIRILLT